MSEVLSITYPGSACLSCCAEPAYDVFSNQINVMSSQRIKDPLSQTSSPYRVTVTHFQRYGLCLQCQEQMLFPSDYFLKYKRDKII